ncbi:hypothetical protein NDU88_005677 [Pleurodeles waltl]|uniref:Secreted protein n=1 Tax=Pleurodeles waltl TaxID=8319 RepID=A0AAV7WYZ1_PLEWA|nr:hypothetical protein NDU88_005677 [Pleurodeles waltl]
MSRLCWQLLVCWQYGMAASGVVLWQGPDCFCAAPSCEPLTVNAAALFPLWFWDRVAGSPYAGGERQAGTSKESRSLLRAVQSSGRSGLGVELHLPGPLRRHRQHAGGTPTRRPPAAHRAQSKQPGPAIPRPPGAVKASAPYAGRAQEPGARPDRGRLTGWRTPQQHPAGRHTISQ